MKIEGKIFCIEAQHPPAEEKENHHTHNSTGCSGKESLYKIKSHSEGKGRSKQEFNTAHCKNNQYFKKTRQSIYNLY